MPRYKHIMGHGYGCLGKGSELRRSVHPDWYVGAWCLPTVNKLVFFFRSDFLAHRIRISKILPRDSKSYPTQAILEACIGVIGIQDICHFTSRDIGYYPFYFQGYRILCSISGILCFLLKNKKKKTEKNSKSPFERWELKKKKFARKIFLTFTTFLFWWRVFTNSKKKAFRNV